MKRISIAVMFVVAWVIASHGIAEALPGSTGPHSDYRVGYGGCTNGAACHVLNKIAFLPETLDNNANTPTNANFTNFCIACHNASGEAHEKSIGTPSNNAYVNRTGLIRGSKGVSHSWDGKKRDAGTRVPVSSFFNRTGYMPHGVVACQTCHNAPIQNTAEWINWMQATSGDQVHYSILGYSSTPQYLNQYLRVYRSASPLGNPPTTYSRDRKRYLVSTSEYTYDNTNATITFKASQGSNNIYIELAEPYLRGSNAANALCVDCHNDRVNVSVSHPSGSGAKSSHPTGINFGYNFGLHTTLKSAPTGNVYIENGQVLCTTCHDPHNAASNNGQILRETDETALCSDCHKTKLDGYSTAGSVNVHNGSKHSSPTVCLDCHDTHNSRNVMLIKNVINGKAVSFQSFTGARSFGPDTGYGVCEVCHTKTGHHLSDNSPSGQGHNTGANCTQCHSHSNGFQVSGPGNLTCDSCHGQPPAPGNAGPVSYGWSDATGNKHVIHMQYIQKKYTLVGMSACATCHGNRPLATHPENLNTAYIDTNNSYWQGRWGTANFSDGGTSGKSSTSDDSCTNVACHFTAGTRYWNDIVAQCDSCHEYPGSVMNVWASTNGHSVQRDAPKFGHMAASGYSAATDTYDVMVADSTRCGKCHPNNAANHQNGINDVAANGPAACGGGNFTFNVITTGRVVTCSNVLCHSGKKTPNWY